MLLLHFASVLLIVLSFGVLVENRSYNTGLIFYDPATQQTFLPPTVSVSRGRSLSHVKFSPKGSIWSTFGKPCDCRGPLCGCCVGIKVKQYNFDQKMCANVTYVKPKEEINLEVYLNETQSAKYGVSARNPSPFCIPIMMPIPMSMCVQMSDVGLQGNNLNMCMDFVVRLASAQLFEMHFQCMKMGAVGVQWVGPDGSPVIPQGASKIKKESKDSDSQEYYDEEEEAEIEMEIDESNELGAGERDGAENERESDYVEHTETVQNVERNDIVDEYENNAQEVVDEVVLEDNVKIMDMEQKPTGMVTSVDEEARETELPATEEKKEEIVEELDTNRDMTNSELEPAIAETSATSTSSVSPEKSNPDLKAESSVAESALPLVVPISFENEIHFNEIATESAIKEYPSDALNEIPIMANLNSALPIKPTTLSAAVEMENNAIANAATIATIISTSTSSPMAAATPMAQDVPATLQTPVAAAATAAATAQAGATAASMADEEETNNSSDNSQDNDSDYEDEESDEHEKDEAEEDVGGGKEEEESNEKKNITIAAIESESLSAQLESVNNVVAANDSNLGNGNKTPNNVGNDKEKGHETVTKDNKNGAKETEMEVMDDVSDDSDDDSDEESDELASDTRVFVQNTNLNGIDTKTVNSLSSSLATNDVTMSATMLADMHNALNDYRMKISSHREQLNAAAAAAMAAVNGLEKSDNSNVSGSDVSSTSDSNKSANTINATRDSMPSHAAAAATAAPVVIADSIEEHAKPSQITAADTVTPLTSARKLFALRRSSHAHPQLQQQQQQQQQQKSTATAQHRERQHKQQQYNKWHYPLHQQVQQPHQQHQHPNHILRRSVAHAPVTHQQRLHHQHHRVHYGA